MAGSECSVCGDYIRPGRSRCVPCEDKKYKAELEQDLDSQQEVDGFKERFSEIAENRKNRKAQEQQARLDAALAWGNAIGEQEAPVDFSDKSVPGSYCSGCGFKLATNSNFCSRCGNKKSGFNLGSSTQSETFSSTKKKSISLVWVISLLLLTVGAVGYGVYGKASNSNSASDTPQDYESNAENNDNGMFEACDHVITAISHHDPRTYIRDSQEDLDIYISEMQIAADIFRRETDINPIAFELTKIAQQMHDGFRGIDEDGSFPLLEYCGA
jgi:uncharacterized OB-fold protein